MKYRVILTLIAFLSIFIIADVDAVERIDCLPRTNAFPFEDVSVSDNNLVVQNINENYYIKVRNFSGTLIYEAYTPDAGGTTYTIPEKEMEKATDYIIYVYVNDNMLSEEAIANNTCNDDNILVDQKADNIRPFQYFEVYRSFNNDGGVTSGDIEYEINKLLTEYGSGTGYTEQFAIEYEQGKLNGTISDSDLTGHELMCDPESTDKDPQNETYYHEEQVTVSNGGICEVTCVEKIYISYGPPIALLAGMGFSYDIYITSEVDCKTSVNTDVIREILTPKPICIPTPSCTGGADYGNTAGGPTEDFEDCIMSCDGGMYTSSCSQQCYQEVYESNNSYVASTTSRILTNPSFVNSAGSVYYLNSCTDYTNYMTANKDDVEIQEALEASYAFYCSPSQIGRTNQRLSSGYYNFYVDTATRSLGILRDQTTNCQSTCYWKSCTGSGANVNGYLEEHTYTTSEQENDFKEALAQVENALRNCSSINISEYEQSSYTTKITNHYQTGNDEQEDAALNLSQSGLIKTFGTEDDSIPNIKILTYKFPESYVDFDGNVLYKTVNDTYVNADGERVNISKQDLSQYNQTLNPQYITNLKSLDTNKEWMLWYYSDPKILPYPSDKVDNIDYNIETELRDVGYFGWELDVDCFYALHNPDLETETNNTDGSGGPNDPVIGGGLDYVFRPIDLGNVFPNEDDETAGDGSDVTGRVPQWNWSDDAKMRTIDDYIVDPIALTEKIESVDYNAYSPEHLDYTIKLDQRAISEIRAYNDEMGSYLNYDANCVPQDDGRTVCESDFNYGSSSVVEVNSKVGCNNSLSRTTCEIITGGN